MLKLLLFFFGGKLNKDNCWVKLKVLICWWELEDKYAKCFRCTNKVEKALSVAGVSKKVHKAIQNAI